MYFIAYVVAKSFHYQTLCISRFFLIFNNLNYVISVDSGLWSTRAPRCQRVECIPPHADPLNGLVTCDNFNNVGSTCRLVA